MLYSLRTRLARTRFARQIAAVRDTPPIAYDPAHCTIVSMVSHDDLWMYILAVKSFYRGLGFGRIVVVNDGTLTPSDLRCLRLHLVEPEVVDHAAYRRPNLPPDVSWERLAVVIERCQTDYVVQLDSDTITVAELQDVRQLVLSRKAFILGTPEGQAIASACGAAEAAKRDGSSHVQTLCEAVLSSLPGADTLRYVRGSSGFFGLPPGSLALDAAERFVAQMTDLVGPRFSEWGSEQVTANFMVANMPGSAVLAHPAHASFNPQLRTEASVFLHFIGSYRFRGGEYARQARRFLALCPPNASAA